MRYPIAVLQLLWFRLQRVFAVKHVRGGTTFPFAKKQHYNIITSQDGTYLSNKVRMETYHFGLLPLGKEVKAIATSCLRTVTFCAYLNVVGIVLFCLARLSD